MIVLIPPVYWFFSFLLPFPSPPFPPLLFSSLLPLYFLYSNQDLNKIHVQLVMNLKSLWFVSISLHFIGKRSWVIFPIVYPKVWDLVIASLELKSFLSPLYSVFMCSLEPEDGSEADAVFRYKFFIVGGVFFYR